ncbi:MAG: hypothetical protein N4A33_05740 [Bacteriovoracaceae bacterium]|jgi:hypothetical protein|nr:hypothetical protein [Bacteriovoracaceae bacterium]
MKSLLLIILYLASANLFAAKNKIDKQTQKVLKDAFLAYYDDRYNDTSSYGTSSIRFESHLKENQQFLWEFVDDIYLAGHVTAAGIIEIKCRVQELINLGKYYRNRINSNSDINNGNLCSYKKFNPKNDSGCRGTSGAPKTSFNGKYDCKLDGQSSTKIRNDDGNKVNISKQYKYIRKVYERTVEKIITVANKNALNFANEKDKIGVAQCAKGLVKGVDPRKINYNKGFAPAKECKFHSDCHSKICDKIDVLDEKGTCSQSYTCFKPIGENQECGLKHNDGFVNSQCLDPDKKGISCIPVNYSSLGLDSEFKKEGMSCSSNEQCASDKCKSGKCQAQSKCTSCVKAGHKVNPNKKEFCCAGYYKDEDNRCIPSLPPLILPHVKVNRPMIFQRVFEVLFPSAHAQDQSTCVPGVNCAIDVEQGNNLSSQQLKEIADKTAACNQMNSGQKETCLQEVANLKSQYSQEAIGENENWDVDSYIKKYNVVPITSKTYSDPKKCKFNTYNDLWKAMSPAHRNAEMVLRGFEYLYSAKGSQDYWIDENGANIFTKAHNVAQILRLKRTALIKATKQNDIKLGCKCIAAFGVANVDQEQTQFYNSGACSSFVGTSISNAVSDIDGGSGSVDDSTVANIDQGASGLSHERFLLDFLETQSSLDISRFTEFGPIEQVMTDLSTLTTQEQWEDGEYKETFLHKVTLKKMTGWFKVVLFLTTGIIGLGIISLLTDGGITSLAMAWKLTFTSALLVAAYTTSYMSPFEPEIVDKAEYRQVGKNGESKEWWCKKKRKKDGFYKKSCAYKYKIVNRYYSGVEYKRDDESLGGITVNGSVSKSNICAIKSHSGQCIRSVHQIKYQGDQRYLLDVKYPLFIDPGKYSLDSKFVDKINIGFQRGIKKLKQAKPLKAMRESTYERVYKNMLYDKKYLQEFLPDRGNYRPAEFNGAMKKAVLEGIKKYAGCKDLVQCGANSSYADTYGFGYLFETQKDIENFAEYVYQHHFVWSSVSQEKKMSYPVHSLPTYFANVLHSMRIVGWATLQSGLGYGDAFDRYLADWKGRSNLYSATGDVTSGSNTINATYSKPVRDLLAGINFQTGQVSNNFDAAVVSGQLGGQKLSSAELSALKTAQGAIDRSKKAYAKYKHYKKVTKSDKRAKIREQAYLNHLNAFSNPLGSRSLSVGGENIGDTGDYFKSAFGQEEYYEEAPKQVASNTYSDDNDYGDGSTVMPKKEEASIDFNMFGSGNSSSHSNEDNMDSVNKSSGMGQEEIDRMLNASKKDRNLKSDPDDNLFTAVSKAYKRNYDRFFQRKKTTYEDVDLDRSKKLNKSKKSSLKKLLEN